MAGISPRWRPSHVPGVTLEPFPIKMGEERQLKEKEKKREKEEKRDCGKMGSIERR